MILHALDFEADLGATEALMDACCTALMRAAIGQALMDATNDRAWRAALFTTDPMQAPMIVSAAEARDWLAYGRGAEWLELLGLVDDIDAAPEMAGRLILAVWRRRMAKAKRRDRQHA